VVGESKASAAPPQSPRTVVNVQATLIHRASPFEFMLALLPGCIFHVCAQEHALPTYLVLEFLPLHDPVLVEGRQRVKKEEAGRTR